MWTPSAFIIIVMAVQNINTIQVTQILGSLSPQERLFFSKDSLRNGLTKFPYAICGLINNFDQYEISCEVHLGSSLDRVKTSQSCGTYRYIRSWAKKLWDSNIKFDVGTLADSNKTIISFEEPAVDGYHNVKRTVIIWDMTTCSKKILEFFYIHVDSDDSDDSEFTPHESYIIMHGNMFEVIVADDSKCQIFRGLCRLTYDANGKLQKVSFPFPIDMVAAEVGLIENSSHKKGYYAVEYRNISRGKISARRITEHGYSRQFDTELDANLLMNTSVSTAHDLFTLCELRYLGEGLRGDAHLIQCCQFDSETGEYRFSATYHYPVAINTISIHNIPSRGFWIAALGCGRKSKERRCELSVGRVEAFDRDWQFYKYELETDCSGGKNEIMLDIEHIYDTQYCFNVLCTSKARGHRDLSFSRKCITLAYKVLE
ncbi:hypothetical protein QAD02_000834 [Eretmocerus hayati]|uniref:Uncharacterized protein n=1 Tax=Eretmocerus hayati TaxID=131215 RepID=A0ACC2NEI6_9HYME|nr:hypothetical protein QAD02_000834 [Eretmocerus hayati]